MLLKFSKQIELNTDGVTNDPNKSDERLKEELSEKKQDIKDTAETPLSQATY